MRLRLQQEQEAELEELIVVDADAFNDTKRRMERDIAMLSDQIQFLDAIHQVSNKTLIIRSKIDFSMFTGQVKMCFGRSKKFLNQLEK
jgi:hypothetical protein